MKEVIVSPNHSIEIVESDIPKPDKDDVVIKVSYQNFKMRHR